MFDLNDRTELTGPSQKYDGGTQTETFINRNHTERHMHVNIHKCRNILIQVYRYA